MKKDISRLVQSTELLPPAFQIVPKLLLLLDDPDSNSEPLAELIRLDPGLTAEVLRVCNSAFYSGGYKAETLSEAVMRIGLREVYQIVMKVIASPVLSQPQKGYGREQGNLWNHSLAAATAAEMFSRDKGSPSEVAFTAALLHDLGKLVVTQALEGDYSRILKEATDKQQSLSAIEKTLFNMDHGEAGGILLNRWSLPANIVAAVKFHHRPSAAGDHTHLAAIVHVSDYLAFLIGQGSGHEAYARILDAKALKLLNVTADDLSGYSAEVKEAFEKAVDAFNK